MGAQLGGWTKKGGTAAEYKSADSNYRTYKPTLSSPPGGGLFTTTKIDHIRGGAKDDHNQLEMEFDLYGQLISVRSVMTIQGTPQFDTGLVKAAGALYNDQAAQIAEVAAKIVNSLASFVTDLNEHGGRANFPAIVRHNLNIIAGCVEAVSPGVPDPSPGIPAATINLYDLAPQALWTSGLLLDDGHSTTNYTELPWNGSQENSQGFARLDVLPLENGTTDTVLLTHPMWVGSGTIKGFLPLVRLTGSPAFEADVGFREGGIYTDGVTFMVWTHYAENGGDVGNLVAQLQKTYTGQLAPIRVDLRHLVGKEVGLELRVDAGPSSGQDGAVWVRPRIVM
jgi:hypothetical protein